MVFLLISEVVIYLQVNITEDLFVDTTRSHKLKINLDLYIPTISCSCKYDFVYLLKEELLNCLIGVDLSLDAMDSAGDQHLHIDHDIFKRRLDLDGHPIDEAKKEEIITSTTIKKENIVSNGRNRAQNGENCVLIS